MFQSPVSFNLTLSGTNFMRWSPLGKKKLIEQNIKKDKDDL